jgi:hypothetical protein
MVPTCQCPCRFSSTRQSPVPCSSPHSKFLTSPSQLKLHPGHRMLQFGCKFLSCRTAFLDSEALKAGSRSRWVAFPHRLLKVGIRVFRSGAEALDAIDQNPLIGGYIVQKYIVRLTRSRSDARRRTRCWSGDESSTSASSFWSRPSSLTGRLSIQNLTPDFALRRSTSRMSKTSWCCPGWSLTRVGLRISRTIKSKRRHRCQRIPDFRATSGLPRS